MPGVPQFLARRPRVLTRSVLVALVVGVAIRLAWVIWATESPSGPTSDPAQYLDMATRFSGLGTPVLYGEHTAFLPPGYGMALAPVAWLARNSGWFSLPFGAALANVAFGGLTIVFTAAMARQWIGRRASAVAAWLIALAPGQVYLTSVALSETLFAALLTGGLVAAAALVAGGDGPRRPSTGGLIAFGVLAGFATLVRAPGLVLLAAPVLTIRARRGGWAGAGRATGWAVVGALVVLVPWTIRNAVQVGVPTPVSTNNAAFLCTGHHDGATGGFDPTPEGLEYCFGGSPYDTEDADEPRWYRRTSTRAVGWALSHPVEEVKLTLWKTWDTMKDDREALDAAQDFGARDLASPRFQDVLDHLADLWHWGVLTLAAAGLALLPSCRRAVPLWATVAVLLVSVWAGLALSRYHHPMMPILVVFAAAALVAVAASARTSEGAAA